MERQKKSCSCFGIFSKKVPKKVDQSTEVRQVIRSSLINFSSNHFRSEENLENNSLSATQKLQSSIPFANTLTSPLCRTPSMFQFSSAGFRENSGKPNTSVKAPNFEEIPQRRNSLPLSPFEEIPKEAFQENIYEEEKISKQRTEKIQSTESSVVLAQEKCTDPAARNSLITSLKDPPYISPSFPKQVNIEEKKELPSSEKVNSIVAPEQTEKNEVKTIIPEPVPIKETVPMSILKENYIEQPKISEPQNLSKVFQVPEANLPVVICEIIEELDENSKNPSPKSNKPEFTPIISKEEPLIHTKTENFQIDMIISKQEEPIFQKIIPKAQDYDDAPPEPDFTSPLLPVSKPVSESKSQPTLIFSSIPKPKFPDPILESNIFIKEAAKKSFENLINRFSSDKKLQNVAEKVKNPVKVPQPVKNLSIHEESLPKIEINPEEPLKVANKVQVNFQSSQEILKEMYQRPKFQGVNLNLHLSPIDHVKKPDDSYSLFSLSDRDKQVLNHSKSLSVNNTVVVHESKDFSKRLSMFSRDFDISYSGKLLKNVLSPAEFSGKHLISPRQANKRLPSLKISPIKSILSADDYSDILSFLKNTPRDSPKLKNPANLDSKKYKLPALKPITPHYFHKKKTALQLKQKARVLVEHL